MRAFRISRRHVSTEIAASSSKGSSKPPVAGSSRPIRSVSDIYKVQDVNVGDLTKTRAFLGFQARATHPESFRYLLGMSGGQAIIDPEETLYSLRKVMHYLKKLTFRGGRTLFVSSTPQLARLTRVIGQQSGQFYLSKKWPPGLLTNWEIARPRIKRMVDIDINNLSGGKLKQSDVVKASYFQGIREMSRPPDTIFILDNTTCKGEPERLNIPVIGLVDTSDQQKHIDYPIPANTKSLRFYHTLAHMIVSSISEGAKLRSTLEEYRVTPEGSELEGLDDDEELADDDEEDEPDRKSVV